MYGIELPIHGFKLQWLQTGDLRLQTHDLHGKMPPGNGIPKGVGCMDISGTTHYRISTRKMNNGWMWGFMIIIIEWLRATIAQVPFRVTIFKYVKINPKAGRKNLTNMPKVLSPHPHTPPLLLPPEKVLNLDTRDMNTFSCLCAMFSCLLVGKKNTGTSFHITQVGLRSLGRFWHTWKFNAKWQLRNCCPEPFNYTMLLCAAKNRLVFHLVPQGPPQPIPLPPQMESRMESVLQSKSVPSSIDHPKTPPNLQSVQSISSPSRGQNKVQQIPTVLSKDSPMESRPYQVGYGSWCHESNLSPFIQYVWSRHSRISLYTLQLVVEVLWPKV